MTLKQTVLVIVLVLVGIQFVPTDRTNPPVETTVVGPRPVMDLFRRACFDCHSNETDWPWYGKVAPFSWLIARDVNRGREKLNFSNWNRLSGADQERLRSEVWKQVKFGNMPPPFYTLGNPDGQVTTDDHAQLRLWAGVPPN